MGRVGFLLIIIQVISKVFALLREMTLSNFYGAGSISDAYIISMTMPLHLITIYSGFLSFSFIPIFNRISKEEGELSAERFTSNLFNILNVFTLAVCILIFLFAKPFIRILALGFDESTLQLAVDFSRITIWSTLFIGITILMTSYLQIKKRFYRAAIAALPMSILMITGIVLSLYFSIYYLAAGVIAGYFAQMLFLFPGMKKAGFKHVKKLKPNNKYLKMMLFMSVPLLVGTMTNQLNYNITRTIASFVSEGAVSALSYAERLNSFAIELSILPVTTLLFPHIAKIVADKDYPALMSNIRRGVSITMMITFPIMAGGFILSREATGVLFFRGAFTEEALNLTSIVVRFNMLGLAGMAIKELFALIFYAHGDTKTLVKQTIIGGVIEVILSLILSRLWGIAGLAIAASLSVTIIGLLTAKFSKQYIPNKEESFIHTKNIIKIFVSALLMGIVVAGAQYFMESHISIVILLAEIGIGALVYCGLLWLFKVDEVNYIIGELKKKFLMRKNKNSRQ